MTIGRTLSRAVLVAGLAVTGASSPARAYFYADGPKPVDVAAAPADPAIGRTLSAGRIAALARRIGIVDVTGPDGRLLERGSGVIVGPQCDIVLTAAHILARGGAFRSRDVTFYAPVGTRWRRVPAAHLWVASGAPFAPAKNCGLLFCDVAYPNWHNDIGRIRLARPALDPCPADLDVVVDADRERPRDAPSRRLFLVAMNLYPEVRRLRKQIAPCRRYDNDEVPGLRLAAARGVILTDCPVLRGASGGGLFRVGDDGRLALIGIQSSVVRRPGVDPDERDVLFDPGTNADVVIAIWGATAARLNEPVPPPR